MRTKRKIGSAAAIGPTIALATTALVLLANGPASRAADLPGQRANQQLPQLRIERPPPGQLPAAPPTAAGPSGSGAYGAIGAGSFPRSFQIPGTSTSIRIGGSIDESFHSRLDP